jgi:hypothetical protein
MRFCEQGNEPLGSVKMGNALANWIFIDALKRRHTLQLEYWEANVTEMQ